MAELANYVAAPVSNGNPAEQAMIRRWWKTERDSIGELVWEYHVEGRYIDAVLFLDGEGGSEQPGKLTASKFPLKGQRIHICEAKQVLNPELIGQALVYSCFARNAGASLDGVSVFCQVASPQMIAAAQELGLNVIAIDA